MDLKKFDSTLKSALENLEEPFDPSTWAALENRLNALPAADAIDDVVRPALERMDASYDAGSWSALAHRMDNMLRIRRLRMTKLAELAIFLLLLLNLKGFFGVVESVTNPVPVKKAIQGPIAKSHAKGKKSVLNRPTGTLSAPLASDQSLTAQVLALVQNITGSSIANPEPSIAEPVAVIHESGSFLDAKNFYSQSGLIKFPSNSILPSQPLEPVLFADMQRLLPQIPGLELPQTRKPSHLYAASFGAFEKNYLKQSGYSDKTNGFGGGFALGYRKGKWGVETGISYAQKNYTPKRENVEYENDPFTGVSYFYTNQVDAEVFAVPVKVTRRLAKLGKTSALAVAGVTGHFATSKRYGFKTIHYDIGSQLPPDPNPVSHPLTTFPNAKGVLENGSFAQNTYATADLGLRMEQSLGKRYIAYVEPVYRHSLVGGLGPSSSRLSTFSLQAGILASL